MIKEKIILASQSPRRKEILEMAAIEFDIHLANIDELIDENLSPIENVVSLAKQKAKAVLSHYENKIVLAADTIVLLENEIIGKPKDEKNAFEILKKLSGKKHEVITGVCIARSEKEESFYDITSVYFNQISDEEINFYIKNYKPFDKAGAYAIQEWIGAVAISKIDGCYYNVVGLPISKVVEVLKCF